MTMLKALLIALSCIAGLAQGKSAEYSGSKAAPTDLEISCNIDETARVVSVKIANPTDKTLYYQRSGLLLDYTAVVTTANERRLPQLKPGDVWKRRHPTAKYMNMYVSTALIQLGPKEEY